MHVTNPSPFTHEQQHPLRPLLIAHRTCPKLKSENSIAGIRLADELGADMVEIDVRGTRDLERVLMHDRSTRRTAGGLWIVSRTSLSRIRALRVKSAEEQEESEPPPLLREALAAVGTRMGVVVEVKDPRIVSGTLADICEAGMADRTLLWSYSERVVKWFVRHATDIEVSLLRDTRTTRQHRAFLNDAAAVGAHGLSICWGAVDVDFADEGRKRGLSVYSMCDAVTPDLQTARLLRGVITDWPTEARTALQAL
ncbi:MAG TPA: glycerophosphodiester phosphodiesterase [Solirubrobacteraceae bacterium]|nr:glycerophosphodiester phosphodiesterase [Solirubrobacteraceae bacterium]